jgi:hypothetical protein
MLATGMLSSTKLSANPPGDGGNEIWVDGPAEVVPVMTATTRMLP